MNDGQQSIASSRIRQAALDMLASREHSYWELKKKLHQRFPSCPGIVTVLDQLRSENLQSDVRFSDVFIRSRARRGQGENRIRMELRNRGIADDLVSQAMDASEIDWFALAKEVAQKKFGVELPINGMEKAKRMRFLQYRGFSYEQIDDVLPATT